MNSCQIHSLASVMENEDDLLSLLNHIKLDEVHGKSGLDKFYPFTVKQLHYCKNPNLVLHRFREFTIPKKNGGVRKITTPWHRSYMVMLYYVNMILKTMYQPYPCVMGFCEGKSIVDNANLHVGSNYVYNTDLRNFFYSIKRGSVIKSLMLPPFSFNQEIATIISGICSMRVGDKRGYKYVLPQGAPTSPILSNIVCQNLDRKLMGLAKRFGLTYSRYADDITFSSSHNVYQDGGVFHRELRRIILSQGLYVNEAKTRLQKRGEYQEVTGLTVTRKTNVSQTYIRNIRNILYIWEKYGYTLASSKFLRRYREDKGRTVKGTPNMENILDGKLMFLKMVRGDTDSVYLRLRKKYDELINTKENRHIKSASGVEYLETYELKQFEKRFRTKVDFRFFEDSRICRFKIEEHIQRGSISKLIDNEQLKKRKNLSISLCRDKEGNEFWLIHLNRKRVRTDNCSSTKEIDW